MCSNLRRPCPTTITEAAFALTAAGVTQCTQRSTVSDYPAEWNRISATPTEDGYLHDARYNIATTVSCVDCGTVLGVTYAEKVYGEPHNLNNIGVCTVCGYTCEHGQINENDTPPNRLTKTITTARRIPRRRMLLRADIADLRHRHSSGN